MQYVDSFSHARPDADSHVVTDPDTDAIADGCANKGAIGVTIY